MSALETRFAEWAAALTDCADLTRSEADGARTLRLVPRNPRAAAVVLYLLGDGSTGTVALDDPACAPAELGSDEQVDLRALDQLVDLAVDGSAVAYRWGRGGCVEVRRRGITTRSFMNVLPLPGWRRRALRVDYLPYR